MGEAEVDASGMVLASEMYASGVEALEDREFVEAADYLAQCLQFHAERSGDTSIEASVIGIKYAEALLGCARMKGTSVLGTMKQPDAFGASTSKAQQPTDISQGQGEDDLQLAWEVAETARLGFEQHAGATEVEDEHFGEVHELLGEIGAEMENFTQAVTDYEKAIEVVTKLEQPDVRWEAEMHFKISVALELADRVGEATEHISIAQTQLKELIKQKEAARQEALSVKVTEASNAVPASAGAVAAEGSVEAEAAAEPAGAVTPAEEPPTAGAGSGATAAGPGVQREQAGGTADTADGVEAAELEEEVKSLRKVIADLAERGQELQALQEQEAVIKEQIKAAIGMPSAPAAGAGPSSALAAAPAQPGAEAGVAGGSGGGGGECVQDLGVITGKRKRKDENDAPDAPVNETLQKLDGDESVAKAGGDVAANVKADTNVA